jgi:chromosome segregation ATPase
MIDTAQQSLITLQQKQADLLKYCENTQITNIDEQKRVEENNTELKAYRKALVELMDTYIAPHRDEISAIKAVAQPYKDRLDELIKSTNDCLDKWHKSQLNVTDEVIMERAINYIEQRKEDAKTGEVTPLPDLAVTEPAKTSHHNFGATNYRHQVEVKIVNSKLVPRPFCLPSESLLKMAGEIAFKNKQPMPSIEGAVITLRWIPVPIQAKAQKKTLRPQIGGTT